MVEWVYDGEAMYMNSRQHLIPCSFSGCQEIKGFRQSIPTNSALPNKGYFGKIRDTTKNDCWEVCSILSYCLHMIWRQTDKMCYIFGELKPTITSPIIDNNVYVQVNSTCMKRRPKQWRRRRSQRSRKRRPSGR